jgi:hypothetical protein
MFPAWDIEFTNKPFAVVFDESGGWDVYPIRLLRDRLFILSEFGVVCHINKKFGGHRFRNKRQTWWYDANRGQGSGRPFDPQKPLTEAQKKFNKDNQTNKEPETVYMQRIEEATPTEKPRYKKLSKEEAKKLEKEIQGFATDEEALAFIHKKGIEQWNPISMESADYEDDGGFDDEGAIYRLIDQSIDLEKYAKRMSSTVVKPKIKIAFIMGIAVIAIIFLVATPQIINGFGSIKLPAMNFGHMILGAKSLASTLKFW